jgi:hypothetical protein
VRSILRGVSPLSSLLSPLTATPLPHSILEADTDNGAGRIRVEIEPSRDLRDGARRLVTRQQSRQARYKGRHGGRKAAGRAYRGGCKQGRPTEMSRRDLMKTDVSGRDQSRSRRAPRRQSSQRPLAFLDFVHLRVTQIIVYFKKAKLRLSYLEKD